MTGWWITLALVAAGAAAIFGGIYLYRNRLGQLVEIERVRRAIARDLHDDLGSSLSRISILTEVAKRKQKLGRRHRRAARPGRLVGPRADRRVVRLDLGDRPQTRRPQKLRHPPAAFRRRPARGPGHPLRDRAGGGGGQYPDHLRAAAPPLPADQGGGEQRRQTRQRPAGGGRAGAAGRQLAAGRGQRRRRPASSPGNIGPRAAPRSAAACAPCCSGRTRWAAGSISTPASAAAPACGSSCRSKARCSRSAGAASGIYNFQEQLRPAAGEKALFLL